MCFSMLVSKLSLLLLLTRVMLLAGIILTPDDILAIILSYLPMQDVSKLRILSRRYRYLILSGPELNFDERSMFGKVRWSKPCERYHKKYLHSFVEGVNQIVKHWSGLSIRSFKVKYDLGSKSASDIDHWIKFAVRMGVQQLQLSCGCYAYDKTRIHQLYTFSTHLLSEASRLRYLRLGGCKLKPNSNGQCHSSRVLDLEYVLLGKCELRHILLRCLNLEEFRLVSCTYVGKLSIDGPFLQLKYLVVTFLKGAKVIELSATKLTKFEYCGELPDFSFSRAPNLENIHLQISDGKESYLLDDILRHVPRPSIFNSYWSYISVPFQEYRVADPTTFKNVIKLDFNFHDGYDLYNVLDLLQTCPHLKKLGVMIVMPRCWPMETTKRHQKYIHSELKEVDFDGFYGTETQIELIIYLLENAVVLKRMSISSDRTMKYDVWGRCNSLDDVKYESFVKQLQVKAATKRVEVILDSVPIVHNSDLRH